MRNGQNRKAKLMSDVSVIIKLWLPEAVTSISMPITQHNHSVVQSKPTAASLLCYFWFQLSQKSLLLVQVHRHGCLHLQKIHPAEHMPVGLTSGKLSVNAPNTHTHTSIKGHSPRFIDGSPYW